MTIPHLETLKNGTAVYASAEHPITTDSLLLADFCTVRPHESACDLGSGCGILLLSLVDKGLLGPAVGVEQSETGTALLRRAAEHNKLPHVQAVCSDLRTFRTATLFHLVVANPPYYASGPASPSPQRAAARHQKSCTVRQLALAAACLLRDKGRFALCWPANTLAELFAALHAARLSPRQMRLVRKSADAPARLALVEARKSAGTELVILPDSSI